MATYRLFVERETLGDIWFDEITKARSLKRCFEALEALPSTDTDVTGSYVERVADGQIMFVDGSCVRLAREKRNAY